MKKGIIFDQDGILFDTERLYEQSWKKAGEQMNVPVPDEFCHAISGSSGQGMYDIVHRFFPSVNPEAMSNLCINLCVEKQKQFLPEKPGLHEILKYGRENGLSMAVASSSREPVIKGNLQKAGIDHYFCHVVSGDFIEHGKPEPDIFLKAAELLGLKPEECYVIEDSFNGVRAGHAAGCFTIMIPDRTQPTEEILALCDACCKDFFEVIKGMEADWK